MVILCQKSDFNVARQRLGDAFHGSETQFLLSSQQQHQQKNELNKKALSHNGLHNNLVPFGVKLKC